MSKADNDDSESTAESIYKAFSEQKLVSEIRELLNLNSAATSASERGEVGERRVAMVLYSLQHRLKPLKDASDANGTAPLSHSVTESVILPDYELEIEGGYAEAKYRRRPHVVWEDPPVQTIPIPTEAMDQYEQRCRSEQEPVYIVVYDEKNENLIYGALLD